MAEPSTSEKFTFRLKVKNDPQLKELIDQIRVVRTVIVPTRTKVPSGAKMEITIESQTGVAMPVTLSGFCNAEHRSGYVCQVVTISSDEAAPPATTKPEPPSRTTPMIEFDENIEDFHEETPKPKGRRGRIFSGTRREEADVAETSPNDRWVTIGLGVSILIASLFLFLSRPIGLSGSQAKAKIPKNWEQFSKQNPIFSAPAN